MTAWATVLLTTLGGGAVGSLITTYAAQSTDRRAARAKARTDLTKAENLARDRDTTQDQITSAMDDLEISAMIARLPRALVDLHRNARVRLWAPGQVTRSGHEPALNDPTLTVVTNVGVEAGQLLSAAMWHPWLTAPYRWYRTRRLTRLLAAATPFTTAGDKIFREASRQRERDMILRSKGKRR